MLVTAVSLVVPDEVLVPAELVDAEPPEVLEPLADVGLDVELLPDAPVEVGAALEPVVVFVEVAPVVVEVAPVELVLPVEDEVGLVVDVEPLAPSLVISSLNWGRSEPHAPTNTLKHSAVPNVFMTSHYHNTRPDNTSRARA